MLIISRKEGEEIIIGDPNAPIGIVRISLIRSGSVKIGFDFPEEIAVNRAELFNTDKGTPGNARAGAKIAPARTNPRTQS